MHAKQGLLERFPDVAKQLVSIEGKVVDPSKIRAGSHKIGKWQCDKGEDHVWCVPVYARTLQGRGCPYCANKKLSATNSLVNFPAVFKEFHPTKNGFAMAHDGKRPYETSVLVVVRALPTRVATGSLPAHAVQKPMPAVQG